MALNIDRIRNKQLETAKGGGNFFKPKDGKNIIRIFKFKHEVTAHDVAKGYFSKDEIGDEVEELDRPVVLHYNYLSGSKKPMLSNSRIMAEHRELQSSSREEDKKRAEEIKPNKKYFLNVVDIDDVGAGMKVFGASKTVFSAVLEILMDREYGGESALFGSKGRDFIIKYDSKAAPAQMYSVVPRAEGNSEKLSKDLEDQAMDLYDPAKLSMFGQVSEEDAPARVDHKDEEEDEDEASAKKAPAGEKEVDDWLSDRGGKKKNGKK